MDGGLGQLLADVELAVSTSRGGTFIQLMEAAMSSYVLPKPYLTTNAAAGASMATV